MSDAHVLETLQANGRSWRDYFLFDVDRDDSRACICSWDNQRGLSVLIIEDDELFREALVFLTRSGARRFSSKADIDAAHGGSGMPSNTSG